MRPQRPYAHARSTQVATITASLAARVKHLLLRPTFTSCGLALSLSRLDILLVILIVIGSLLAFGFALRGRCLFLLRRFDVLVF